MANTELDRLMNQALRMDTTPVRLSILEEAARHADNLGDIKAGFDVRFELMRTAAYCGAPDRLLVAFAWCLTQYDSNPTEIDQFDLLWGAKWVVDFVESIPSVSRDRIESLTDDIEERFRRAGYSLRPITQLRARAAVESSSPDVSELRLKWMSQPRDSLADCQACEEAKDGEILFAIGRLEDGLSAVDAVLQQRHVCKSQPHLTYGRVLTPLIRLGRIDLAEQYHATGYPKVAGNPHFLETIGQHMKYLVFRRQLEKAIRIMERHCRIAMCIADGFCRLGFYSASALLLEALSQRSRRGTRKLRLPDDFPVERSDNDSFVLSEVRDWFAMQAQDVAGQFDRRNGNDRYRQLLMDERKVLLAD